MNNKITNINFTVAVAVSALVFASCTQETPLTEEAANRQPADKEVPINISATLEAGLTRATGTPTALAEGSTIGIFRIADDNYTAVANTPYTLNEGKWPSASPIFVSSKEAKLCAYYPYAADGVNSWYETTLSLPVQIYAPDKDVCFATVDADQHITNTAPDVTFAMQRAYSQLTLAMTRDNKYPLVCKVTHVQLQSSYRQIRKLDIKTGIISDYEVSGWEKFETHGVIHDTGLTPGVRDDSFRLLFPPQNFTDESSNPFKLCLTIDDYEYTVVIPFADLPELKRGTNHVISLKITDGEPIQLTGVSTKEWDTSGGTHSGDASQIQ